MMAETEEKKFSIKGLETNCKLVGNGPPLLILHGWNGSSDSWGKTVELLKKNFQIISPDFPGFGKSQPPHHPWELNDFVAWTKELVDLLNLKKIFLLGHSFGGRVAIKFSIFYPERVNKLILVDSAGIKPKWGPKEKITFLVARMGNAFFSPRIFIRFKESAKNFFYKIFRVKDWAKANGVLKETMKNIINEDLLPELEKIKVKTYIIWGEKDKIVPIKYAFIFKEKISDSKLKILPQIRHSPHLEDPLKLAKIIEEILLSKEV